MIPILYSATETEFDSNGLGPLTDAIECTVTEERNGKYELSMKYPITGQHYADIKKRCQITAKPAGNKEPQPFRVYDISRPMGGIVTVKAQHISYDLSGIIADPMEAGSATGALQFLHSKTIPANPFEFWTDKGTAAKFTNPTPASVRSLLGGKKGSILDVYGGEWEFDRYLCRLWEHRGRDNGVTIRYGKNLTDLKQDENCANIRTGIYPFWKGQVQKEGQEQSEDVLVTLPEKVVSAPGEYDFTAYKTVDFSRDFQVPPTVDQLRARAEKYVKDNQIGVPKVSLTVKFAQLEQSEEYKDLKLLEQVNLCDTVTVIFPALGVETTAKCIKTVYDVLLDRMERVELGESRPSISDTIAGTQDQIQDAVESLTQELPTAAKVRAIAMQVTAQILGARGGAVRLLDTDNDGTPDTLYIADNPDPAKAVKIWRWNYEGWGASSKGYNGPFEVAATLEHGLYADFITAGTLTANLLKAGTIMDSTNTNYWNLDTGEAKIDFKELSIQGVTPQSMADTAESNAKSAAKDYVDAQTQDDIFNKLTNGGQAQGIYIKDGQIYISAEYIVAGLLRDKNRNFVLNLNTGEVDIKTGNITLGPNGELKLTDEGSIDASQGNIGGFELSNKWLHAGGLYLVGSQLDETGEEKGGMLVFRDDVKKETFSIMMDRDLFDYQNGLYCSIVPNTDFIVRCWPDGKDSLNGPDYHPSFDLIKIRAGDSASNPGVIEISPNISVGGNTGATDTVEIGNGVFMEFINGIFTGVIYM